MTSDPDRLVPIGRVGRPHGLDGFVLVEDGSDDPRRWQPGERVYVDGVPAVVRGSRRVGRGRRAVDLDPPARRGAQLAVRVGDLPPPEPGAWYAFELVGLRAEEEGGRPLGSVRDVHPGVANDNLELEDGTLVPLIDAAVVDVDLAAGRVVVRRGFL